MVFSPFFSHRKVSESGVHRPHVAGIHGREHEGAYSIVLSGGYEDDVVSRLKIQPCKTQNILLSTLLFFFVDMKMNAFDFFAKVCVAFLLKCAYIQYMYWY